MGVTIAPENILRELSELWVDLGRQYEEESATGVLRACTMTLLVVAEASEDAQALNGTLAEMMPEHPSRLIVLRVRPGGERNLESRVFAQCWMPFGTRRHICCEQIEITASEGALDEVPSVVLPLAVPDLPVMLWCRGARLFELPAFGGLAAMARKTILDSAVFPDPGAILRKMAVLTAPSRDRQEAVMTLGDLTWTRLTPWRALLAQIFENREYLAGLPGVTEARVEYAGATAPVSARYLAAWLGEGLRAAGSRARPVLEPSADRRRRVELGAPGLRISLSQAEGRCAEVRINDMASRTAVPEQSESVLMREELSLSGPDPLFERTLAFAAAVAVSS